MWNLAVFLRGKGAAMKKHSMFLDKTIMSVSHTNPMQTSIIQSSASAGPEMERPSFLLYPDFFTDTKPEYGNPNTEWV